ncbi:hypothetical protein GLOIN_2v708233 [Rhizophagus clarus]|uniref:Reverse transcriptase domain-containing protein n=1 Tax=Rhizophagus clarus TaxID=94130 RepID=A0A8H3LDN5_9GLOM|nr:hypothetical protein GLOIN_2v708233 [Rhizophagus clarus]
MESQIMYPLLASSDSNEPQVDNIVINEVKRIAQKAFVSIDRYLETVLAGLMSDTEDPELPKINSRAYQFTITSTCSPLLWITYYDPLFEAINSWTMGGITLKGSIPRSIASSSDNYTLQENIKLLGYLDDTTWIENHIDNLEILLSIADNFYHLANIKSTNPKPDYLQTTKIYSNLTQS